jgi:SAM-dependent methyltransferase
MTATFSPEDNKLRLYSLHRLDAATYTRVKNAGFKFAPKQDLFFAPAWTPAREDLLLELCGEIGDEDTSLVDRAAERADRFEEYRDKRANDAHSARAAVASIADNIPMGQPILVGHHSERHARKDADRIENGMRRAVQMWETAEYWKQRAAGALRHAKYKELPAVRHRRIKGLEADARKQQKNKEEAENWLKLWLKCEAETDAELQQAAALRIANVCWLHLPRKEGDREDFNQCPTAYDALRNSHPTLYAPRTLAEVLDAAKKTYPVTIAHCTRWLAHLNNRIAYERAMLDEQGGLKADAFDIQPGGRVLVSDEWLVVLRVNKKDGKACSVTTNARFVSVRGIEEIKDYRAPTEDEAAKVKAATKLAPLVNFPGEGIIEMTAAEYKRKPTDYKNTSTVAATANHGAYRCRTAFLANGGYRTAQVYITDAKRVDPPAAPATPVAPVTFERVRELPSQPAAPVEPAAEIRKENPGAAFDALREQLKAGVQVVAAPQLFPTPAERADIMVDEADIFDGARILEPEAGTGRIVRAIRKTGRPVHIVAVEIDRRLADGLRAAFPGVPADVPQEVEVINRDFLEMTPADIGTFDFVLMNPPFVNGADITHIKHAQTFLRPGGRLVALCATGPRQTQQLQPLVNEAGGTWEVLPAGSFVESGTRVNVAQLIIDGRDTGAALSHDRDQLALAI